MYIGYIGGTPFCTADSNPYLFTDRETAFIVMMDEVALYNLQIRWLFTEQLTTGEVSCLQIH